MIFSIKAYLIFPFILTTECKLMHAFTMQCDGSAILRFLGALRASTAVEGPFETIFRFLALAVKCFNSQLGVPFSRGPWGDRIIHLCLNSGLIRCRSIVRFVFQRNNKVEAKRIHVHSFAVEIRPSQFLPSPKYAVQRFSNKIHACEQ